MEMIVVMVMVMLMIVVMVIDGNESDTLLCFC